jgi:hypothetical protein
VLQPPEKSQVNWAVHTPGPPGSSPLMEQDAAPALDRAVPHTSGERPVGHATEETAPAGGDARSDPGERFTLPGFTYGHWGEGEQPRGPGGVVQGAPVDGVTPEGTSK